MYSKPRSIDLKTTALQTAGAVGGVLVNRVIVESLTKNDTDPKSNKKLLIQGALALAGGYSAASIDVTDSASSLAFGASLAVAAFNTLDIVADLLAKKEQTSAKVLVSNSTARVALGLDPASASTAAQNSVVNATSPNSEVEKTPAATALKAYYGKLNGLGCPCEDQAQQLQQLPQVRQVDNRQVVYSLPRIASPNRQVKQQCLNGGLDEMLATPLFS